MVYGSILRSMHAVGVPVFVVDRQSDGQFYYAGQNSASTERFGLSDEEMVGNRPHDIIPDVEKADLLVRKYTECLDEKQRVVFEDTFQFTDGPGRVRVTLTPVEGPDGQLTRIVGAYEDTTWLEEIRQRYQESEARYMESEERYRSLLDSAPIGISVYIDGVIFYANQELARMLHIETPSQLIGRQVKDFVHPDDLSQMADRMMKAKAGDELGTAEYRLLLDDGTVTEVQASSTLVRYLGSDAVQTTIKDVTAIKRAQEAELQLEKERELRAFKSRFVAMVAHDFRNPLASILLSLNVVEKYMDTMDADRRQRKFDSLYAQIDQMNELLEDVLTISQLEDQGVQFDPVPLDVELLCQEIFDNISENQGCEHFCLYEGAGQSVYIEADRQLLKRAIVNLFSNAIKYSSPGTTVTLSLCVDEPGQEVCIQVTDQGIGVPKRDLPVLFNPFHRASNVGQRAGTGLGLAIVKHVAELHQGTVECESELGSGTLFSLYLPVAA